MLRGRAGDDAMTGTPAAGNYPPLTAGQSSSSRLPGAPDTGARLVPGRDGTGGHRRAVSYPVLMSPVSVIRSQATSS